MSPINSYVNTEGEGIMVSGPKGLLPLGYQLLWLK